MIGEKLARLMDRSDVHVDQCVPEKITKLEDERMARLAVLDVLPASLPDGNGVAPVLDVGPGAGWDMLQLRDRYPAHPVAGISLSALEVEACADLGFLVEQADMHDMPASWTGMFGLVFASHVLEHSPAPLLALVEFRRVLKTGGLLMVVMPEPTGYTRLHPQAWSDGKRPKRLDTFEAHVFMPDVGTVISLMRRAGFTFDAYHEIPQPCDGLLQFCHRVWLGTAIGKEDSPLWEPVEAGA